MLNVRGICQYLLLTIHLLFFITTSVFSQSLEEQTSAVRGWDAQVLLGEVLDSNTIAALSEAGILDDYSRDVFQEYKSLFSENTDSLKFFKKKIKLPVPHAYASWDHKYIRNHNGINEDWVNLGHLNIGASVTVLGLPFDGGVQAGILNNKFNWNLSSVDFDFDQRALLEKQVSEKLNGVNPLESGKYDELTNRYDQLKSADIKKFYSGRIPDPNILNNPFDSPDVDLIKNELKSKLLNFIVNHPKYQELYANQIPKDKEALKNEVQNRAKSQADSLKNKAIAKGETSKDKMNGKKDSLSQRYDKVMTTKDSLSRKFRKHSEKISKAKNTAMQVKDKISNPKANVKSAIADISSKYRETWEDRKRYYGDSLQNFKARFLSGTSKADIKKMSKDSLLSILESKTGNTGIKSVMQRVNQLNIGRAVINDHWFLAENLSLNGAKVGYEKDNYAFQAGAGGQRFDYSIFPLLGVTLPTKLPNRTFLYGSAEYKVKDAFSLKFSTLNSKESINELSGPTALERVNNVFLVSGITHLIGGLSLEVDAAYSRTNGVFVQLPDNSPAGNADRGAGEAKLNYQIPKTNLNVEVGYFYLGSQYVSLGNPFIRNGQKGLTFGLKGTVFNRLDFDFSVRDGQSTESNKLEPAREDLVINGSARLNISKNLSLSASVFPNFTNYQLNELFKVESNLWTTSYELQHTAIGERLSVANNISYSNSINELVLQDSLGVQNYDGLIYYGNLMFQSGFGVDALAMGFSDEGIFKTGINSTSIQLNLIFNKKNKRFHAGLIYGQDKSKLDGLPVVATTVGVAAGADLSFFKFFNIGVESRLPVYTKGEIDSQRIFQEYINTKLKFKF